MIINLMQRDVKLGLLCLFFSLYINLSSGQKQNKMLIGANLFNELNFSIQKESDTGKYMGLDIALVLPLTNHVLYSPSFFEIWVIPMRVFNDKGIKLRYIIDLNKTKNNSVSTLKLEYAYLKSNVFYKDPGSFAGSNSSPYSEFTQIKNMLSVMYTKSTPLGDSKLYFNWGIGIRGKLIERKYIVEGTRWNKVPSNKIEHFPGASAFMFCGFQYQLSK